MNEHYIAANFNVDADEIDLIAWNYGFQVYAGDSVNYNIMRDYILNTDLSVEANYRQLHNLIGWNGLVENSDSLSVTPMGDMTVTAIFEPMQPTSEIVINEINYKSAPYFDVKDWIELNNTTNSELDLSDWMLKDDHDDHCFIFPEGTKIAPNGYLLLTERMATFRAFFPQVQNVIGDFDFGFSSHGDIVRLFDNHGRLIDMVAYQSTRPWPTKANGWGATLALVLPNADRSVPANWYASMPHGTPGRINIQSGPIEVSGLQLVSLATGGELQWTTNVKNCGNIFRVQQLLQDS
jgi:hypothetical protein